MEAARRAAIMTALLGAPSSSWSPPRSRRCISAENVPFWLVLLDAGRALRCAFEDWGVPMVTAQPGEAKSPVRLRYRLLSPHAVGMLGTPLLQSRRARDDSCRSPVRNGSAGPGLHVPRAARPPGWSPTGAAASEARERQPLQNETRQIQIDADLHPDRIPRVRLLDQERLVPRTPRGRSNALPSKPSPLASSLSGAPKPVSTASSGSAVEPEHIGARPAGQAGRLAPGERVGRHCFRVTCAGLPRRSPAPASSRPSRTAPPSGSAGTPVGSTSTWTTADVLLRPSDTCTRIATRAVSCGACQRAVALVASVSVPFGAAHRYRRVSPSGSVASAVNCTSPP